MKWIGGCELYLVSILDIKMSESRNNQVQMIKAFNDMFLEELSGLSPISKDKYVIDMILETT